MKLLRLRVSEADLRAFLPDAPQGAEVAAVAFDYYEHALDVTLRVDECTEQDHGRATVSAD